MDSVPGSLQASEVRRYLEDERIPITKRFVLVRNCIRASASGASLSIQTVLDWLQMQFVDGPNDTEALKEIPSLLQLVKDKQETKLIIEPTFLEALVVHTESAQTGLEAVVDVLNNFLDDLSLLRCIIRDEQLLMRLAGSMLRQQAQLLANPEYYRLLGRLGFQLQEKNRLHPSSSLLKSFISIALPAAINLLLSSSDLVNVTEAKNRWKVVVQNYLFANNLYEDWKNCLFSTLGANQPRPYYPESIDLIMNAIRLEMAEEKIALLGEILVDGFIRRYKKAQPEAFIFMNFLLAMFEVYPEGKDEPAVIRGDSEAALSLKLEKKASPEMVVECVLRVLGVLKEREYNIRTELDGIRFVNWLQNLLQFLMKEFGKTVPRVMKVCEVLIDINPVTIQYVPGPIIKAVLSNRTSANAAECDALLTGILRAYVKLRNVPKFMQLLLQASRLLRLNADFVGENFTKELENVVTLDLIPTQVITLWSQTLEGMEKDVEKGNLDRSEPSSFLLASIILSGRIVEHTLPAVQFEEMEQLTRRTRSVILSLLEKGSCRRGLAKLIFSFNEFHSLLMRYVSVYRDRFISDLMEVDLEEVPGVIVVPDGKFSPSAELEELQLQSKRLSNSHGSENLSLTQDLTETSSLARQFATLCEASNSETVMELTKYLLDGTTTKSATILSVLEVLDSRRIQAGIILNAFRKFESVEAWKSLAAKVLEDLGVWFDSNEKDQKAKIKELSTLVVTEFIEHMPDEADDVTGMDTVFDILLKFPVESFDNTLHGLLLCYILTAIGSTANVKTMEKACTLLVVLLDTPDKVSPLYRFFDANQILPWVVENLRKLPDVNIGKAVLEVMIETATKSIGCMESFTGFAKEEPNDMTRVASVILLENLRKSRKRLQKSPKLPSIDNLLKSLVKSFQKSLKASPNLQPDLEHPGQNAALLNACSCILQIHFENKSTTKFKIKTVLNRLPRILNIAYEGLKSESVAWGSESKQMIDLVLDHRSALATKVPGDLVIKVWDAYKTTSVQERWKDGLIRRILSSVKKMELARICSDLVEGIRSSLEVSDFGSLVKFSGFMCQLMQCQMPPGPRTDIRRDALHTAFSLLQNSRTVWKDGATVARVCTLIMECYRVLLTAQQALLSPFELALSLDEIINAPLEACPSVSEFEALFLPSFKILHSVLSRHEELAADRMPVVIRCFSLLLTSVVSRFHQGKQLQEEDLKSGIVFAEKLGSLVTVMADQKLRYRRVAPYIIADILEHFQKFTLYPAIREQLLHGLYSLMSILDRHAVSQLMATLPSGSREVFKMEYESFQKYHKYTGKLNQRIDSLTRTLAKKGRNIADEES